MAATPRTETWSSAPVVCLCGSRAQENLRQAEADLTLAGKIVLPPFVSAHLARSPITAEQHAQMAELHRSRIDLADEVVVVNPGNFLGEAAAEELAYALRRSVPVSFTEPVVTMQLRDDYFEALLGGTKTVEVRRLDAKRASIIPNHIVQFTAGPRTLVARVLTVNRSPNPATFLTNVDPATVIPGASRDELAKALEELYPGIIGSQTPLAAFALAVLGEQPAIAAAASRRLPQRLTATWHDGLPPAGVQVTGVSGWLVDPLDGRVLIQSCPDGRFALPGGRIEDVDGGDLVATLVREAAEKSQVEIDPDCVVYLGCIIVTGHPDQPDPHATARFLAPITLYEPIGLDADRPTVIYRRLMTSLDRAPALLDRGNPGRREATAAHAAARALGFPVDHPRSEGFRDGGDPEPDFDPDDRIGEDGS